MVPDSDSLGRNIDLLSSFSRRQNAFVGHWQARGCLPVGCIPRPRPRSCFLQDVGGGLLQSTAFHKSGEFAGAGTNI